jgi:hypothetical protein
MFNNFFSLKSCRLWGNAKKYGGAGEDADNMALALGVLDKSAYTLASTSLRLYTHTPPPPHTYTHRNVQYLLLSTRQQSFRERPSMLFMCNVLKRQMIVYWRINRKWFGSSRGLLNFAILAFVKRLRRGTKQVNVCIRCLETTALGNDLRYAHSACLKSTFSFFQPSFFLAGICHLIIRDIILFAHAVFWQSRIRKRLPQAKLN